MIDILFYIYNLGRVLEGWIPHNLVGAAICRVGLALKFGALLELVIYFSW
jgi:hypothetical protein